MGKTLLKATEVFGSLTESDGKNLLGFKLAQFGVERYGVICQLCQF